MEIETKNALMSKIETHLLSHACKTWRNTFFCGSSPKTKSKPEAI